MTEGQRKRGVQASRTKLTRALNLIGLRSQAALAERIAEQHDLDRAPKEMVSRAFREQAIDPTSLERIAQALETPAHKLMLSSNEASQPSQPQTPTSAPNLSIRNPGTFLWVAAVTACLLIAILLIAREQTIPSQASYDSAVVRNLSDTDATALIDKLRVPLSADMRVASETAAAYDEIPSDIVERLRVGAVIDIDVVE